MYEALDTIPAEELEVRWECCRQLLRSERPKAGGLLVFSRPSVYWLSGHWANGFFWLPLEGQPVLFIRKGGERARLESAVRHICHYRSLSDVPARLAELGAELPATLAVEMSGLSWLMGQKLTTRLSGHQFEAGDSVLSKARAVKSNWELDRMRLAGRRHAELMQVKLPTLIEAGMNELEMALQAWQEAFNLGHQGVIRMSGEGEELFLGVFAAGDSGNYPVVFSGPVGFRGIHPAVPQMGYAGKVWQEKEILIVDTVFSLEGYHTDKSQLYFAGSKEDMPKQAREAMAFCLDMEAEVAERLKPGITPREIYEHCLQEARRQGFEDGFMGLGGNKVPFVGHGIGLQVDEWPALASTFEEPLQENMTLAVEPKVGLPELGMVGVENTFRVAAGGGECLTGQGHDVICMNQ